jgi:hypothetical protein
MTSGETTWRVCSTCKKPIAFARGFYACSVSTCNRRAALFVFCSVACWDAHVPVMRHRDAWAVEETAPTAAEWARQQEDERTHTTPVSVSVRPNARAPRRVTVASPFADGDRSPGARLQAGPGRPRDVLVVVSKLKAYIRAIAGMNTSDDVAEVLSDRLRDLCDAAVEQARAAARKTVMARDFRRA